jgi:alpha-beta hydrolase superfamily lysophospholipase
MGHSMGGLLAADAATDLSNKSRSPSTSRPHRIVGVVAFDTPYLGMHPHVVKSGIASLFKKADGEKTAEGGHKSEKQMNDTKHVKVVDQGVTDDWEEFKKRLNSKSQLSITRQT